MVAKFRKLTTRTVTSGQADRLAELVLGCEKLPDVAPLIEGLRAG